MISPDAIQFAIDSTVVLREPIRRIDTFGSTQFEFFLITELMDNVGAVRIRNGIVKAEKPTILRPSPMDENALEGFGPQAGEFFNWLRAHAEEISVLRYGFSFRQENLTEELVREDILTVTERVLSEANRRDDPLQAVIQGVDEAWEVCLLKFAVEMIEKSQGVNIFDFKRRGLL